MKRAEIRDHYGAQTLKASDVARNLAFAGIATIWAFKGDLQGRPVLSSAFMPAAVAFSVALICDLLQYASAAGTWTLLNFIADRKRDRDERNHEKDAGSLAIPRPSMSHQWHSSGQNFLVCSRGMSCSRARCSAHSSRRRQSLGCAWRCDSRNPNRS
jgi:hypothetical protein